MPGYFFRIENGPRYVIWEKDRTIDNINTPDHQHYDLMLDQDSRDLKDSFLTNPANQFIDVIAAEIDHHASHCNKAEDKEDCDNKKYQPTFYWSIIDP